MSAAELINSLFRLQPRLTLQPTERIPGVPLSHRGHCSNSLTHESLVIERVFRGNASCKSRAVWSVKLANDAANICVDKKICYYSILSKLRKYSSSRSSIQSKNCVKPLRLEQENKFAGFSQRYSFFVRTVNLCKDTFGNIIHSRNKFENKGLIRMHNSLRTQSNFIKKPHLCQWECLY